VEEDSEDGKRRGCSGKERYQESGKYGFSEARRISDAAGDDTDLPQDYGRDEHRDEVTGDETPEEFAHELDGNPDKR
jgi:hypothetical protein